MTYHRTPDGVSTQVYRLTRSSETFYLRVAEEADDNLETEVELHQRLYALGVGVAGVIYVEAFHEPIGRSIMITTEVPGRPVAGVSSRAVAEAVVRRAGADLAVLNQLPVDGFGWVRRDRPGWPLRGREETFAAYLTSDLPAPWPGRLAALFPGPVLAAVEAAIDHERRRPPARAHLAHGDFDATHIFYAENQYSGVIDFGEIRGTELLFDLGHFALHDRPDARLLPALLEGYQQVQPLPPDHEPGIRRCAILSGLRQLCRWLSPDRGYGLDNPAVTDRVRRINHLVTTGPRRDLVG